MAHAVAAELTALGYIGIRSGKLDDWHTYATGLLGIQRVDCVGSVRAFRMDDRKQRLIVTGDEGEGLSFLGWEVANAAALDAVAARLETHGVAVRRGSRSLAGERHVADLILFEDPAGNRLEVFYGPAVAADPFQPGHPISGFRTGPLGLGHAVLQPVFPLRRGGQRLAAIVGSRHAGIGGRRWSINGPRPQAEGARALRLIRRFKESLFRRSSMDGWGRIGGDRNP
jgi:hypothetical protein